MVGGGAGAAAAAAAALVNLLCKEEIDIDDLGKPSRGLLTLTTNLFPGLARSRRHLEGRCRGGEQYLEGFTPTMVIVQHGRIASRDRVTNTISFSDAST